MTRKEDIAPHQSPINQRRRDAFESGLLPAKLLGERIKAGITTAGRMLQEPVDNLADLRPKPLGLGDRLMWDPFFRNLREYPIKARRSAIAGVLGHEGLNLPHAEDLTDFLTDINNNEWFFPPEEPSFDSLKEQVDRSFATLGLPSQQLAIVRDWQEARNKSRKRDSDPKGNDSKDLYDREKCDSSNSWGLKIDRAALDVYSKASDKLGQYANQVIYDHLIPASIITDRLKRGSDTTETEGTIYDVPWGPTYDGGFGGPVEDIREAVGNAGLWIIMQDEMPKEGYTKGNPFLPLVELYKKGLWPIGSLNAQFSILIPPSPDPQWQDEFRLSTNRVVATL